MKAPAVGRWEALGLARAFRRGDVEWLDGLRARFGDVVHVPAPVDRYLLFAPGAIRQVLQDDHRLCHKGANYRELEYLMGRSLVTSEGARWVEQRRGIGRLFQQESARRSAQSAARVAPPWAARLAQAAGPGRVLDLAPAIGELACAITCDFLFGPVCERDVQALHRAGTAASETLLARVHAPLRLPRWVPLRAHRREAAARRHIDAFIHERVERALTHLDHLPTRSFLEAALRGLGDGARQPGPRAELRDHLVTLLRAGQDTMEAALSWFFHLCARHPAVQSRIRDESALGAEAPGARAAFLETLRLFPPIPVLARTLLQDAAFGSVRVPAGAGVLCAVRSVQRDPRYWSEAAVFRPERFLEGRADATAAYFAFGVGPRRCIGENAACSQAVIVARELFSRVRLEAAAGHEPHTRTALAMKPAPDLRLRLAPLEAARREATTA